MLKTLITNNCWGGVIASNHNMRFCSPTVNLQILPEEFPQFCKNLDFYMRMELIEYEHLTEWHHGCMKRMFGDSPPDCPLGLVYDTIVVFQHYDSFEEAKAAWDRRKERIDKDSIGYMFHIKDIMYQMYAERFISLDLPNSVCITEDFEMDGAYAFHVPGGQDAFGGVIENGQARRIIEENFKINDWLEGRL